ncbi:hypothetical protein GPALN_002120 [Globodera pallida]|nr:hypothetical protein GPALN_002120 [Globodera pallida]
MGQKSHYPKTIALNYSSTKNWSINQELDQNYYTSSQEHSGQSDQQQDQSSNNESDQSSSLADSDHSDQVITLSIESGKKGEEHAVVNIYKWRRALGIKQMPTTVDEHTKLELIDQFDKMMKDRRPENAYQDEQHCKIALEIARELGTSQKRKYTDSERLELIAKFDKMKGNNPTLSDEQIAESLGIKMSTIKQWRRKLGVVPK